MRTRARAAVSWAAVGLVVAVAVVLVGWRLHGGRWERVQTPSMGTVAPVGTLLWVAPVSFDSLRPGDLITFTPPGVHGTTYTHLVRSVNADGTISTQGAITAPDPWRLRPGDLVGRAVMRWRGVGWVVLATPVLALGGLLLWSVVRRLRDRDSRLPVVVVGAAVVLVAALTAYQPLTRAEQISFVPAGHGARATYVSTGLLPLRLTADHGGQVVLRDGQVDTVLAPGSRTSGGSRYAVSLRPAVPMSWWIALIGLCFLPAALRTVAATRGSPPPLVPRISP